jgi:hypothetical protein
MNVSYECNGTNYEQRAMLEKPGKSKHHIVSRFPNITSICKPHMAMKELIS